MTSCDACGGTILFGGVRDGGRRYCNQKCYERGVVHRVAQELPDDVVSQFVQEVHEGNCPKCNGPGPVDVHVSHRIWSALVMTSWGNSPQICCRSCGNRSKINATIFSALFGWWGFPWGLMTPIIIFRNISACLSSRDTSEPSAELANMVRLSVAGHHAEFLREQSDQT